MPSMAKPPERMRFSVVPKYELIEFVRPNAFKVSDDDPDTVVVELKAWPKGERCPSWVAVQVAVVHDAYTDAVQAEAQRQAESGARGPSVHGMMDAIATMRKELLCAVIEGLEEHEASLLVEDGGPWETILTNLNWWHVRQPDEEVPEDTPEVKAGEEGIVPSSPA
jgi:hypothetical protein